MICMRKDIKRGRKMSKKIVKVIGTKGMPGHITEGEVYEAFRDEDNDLVFVNDTGIETYVYSQGVENGEIYEFLKPIYEESSQKPEQAKRFNTGKVEFHDAPMLGMVEVAKVAGVGRAKYEEFNWKKPASENQYYNCALRHLIKGMYGQDNDSETKCYHLAHAAWNCLAALEKIMVGNRVDDRYKGINPDILEDLFKLSGDQTEVIKKILEDKEKNNGK